VPLTDVAPQAPAAGARIANARGVPGTLGCFALTARREAVLLTSHHVLFGAGAGEGDAVWLVGGTAEEPTFERLGRARRGFIGTVGDCFVDCAVAALDAGVFAPRRPRPEPPAARPLQPGDAVTKTGGATGTTEGVVVDVDYLDMAVVEGRTWAAPRQILVRGRDGQAFSAEGDSGARLRDAAGGAAGLLWGVNRDGMSVACPLGPALEALGVVPVRTRWGR
jgi:hypothetical protein